MTYYNPTIELMTLKEQEEIQTKRLKELVDGAYRYSKFHKAKFDSIGFKPEHIKSLDDLQKLPLMDKFDLLENSPFDFICLPQDEIDKVFISGGTSGKPKVIFSNSQTVKNEVGKYTAIIMTMARADKQTILGALAPFGPASVGTSIVSASENIGLFLVPLGLSLDPKFALELVRKLNVNSLVGPATVFNALIKSAKEQNIELKDFKIKEIMTGVGVPLSKSMRSQFEDNFGCEVFNIGGATECDPMGGECSEHSGLHFFPTWYILEVLDTETKQPVEEGEVGELVLTKIGDKSMGIIRYQLGDLGKITTEKCKCGRTLPRFWFLGRTSERVVVAGDIKHEPYQTLEALNNLLDDGVSANYQLKVNKESKTDILNFKIEVLNDDLLESQKLLEKIRQKLENISASHKKAVADGFLVINIELVPYNNLPKTPRGKPKHQVVDLRKD